MRWTLLAFVLGIWLIWKSFTQIPCFATRCASQKMIGILQEQWTIFVVYYVLLGFYLGYRQYLSFMNQTRANKMNKVCQALRSRYSFIPRITNLDLIHFFVLSMALLWIFSLYYTYYLPLVKEKLITKKLAQGAVESRTSMFAFGHWCDFLIALNLLPVTSKSFLSTNLNLSTGTLVRYHQTVGILLFISIFAHGVSYLYYLSCHESPQYLKELFMIGKEFVFKNWKNPLGVLGFGSCFLLVLTSLWMIRRRNYQFFLICHYLLIPIFLGSAFFHAITNFYFSIPALILYTLDLLHRLMQKCKAQEGLVILEESGMIRLETCFVSCKPGQYFYITIPEISNLSHPFSVASLSASGMGFLIQPSKSNSWTHSLLSMLKNESQTTVSMILDGPYGLAPFDYETMHTLVLMVGGSGITTVLPCVREAVKQGIPCQIHWSVRIAACIQVTYFQELLTLENLEIHVYITGDVDVESSLEIQETTTLQIQYGRMSPSLILASTMLSCGNALVGLYTCGPRALMDSVEAASTRFDNLFLYRESYEW
jgi:ferredoxin-NADP reductase